MEDLYKLTAADRLIRSRIIAKGELVSLMGRSLFQEAEYLEIIFKRLSALREIIGDSVTTAPRLFRDSKIEWAKVTKRLAAERHKSSTDRQSRQLAPRYITDQMWAAWADFGAFLVTKQKESHKSGVNQLLIVTVNVNRRIGGLKPQIRTELHVFL
ncbi:hypothetical protein FRC09_016386 [Ceratobasidium sp. 395]|nr:hypothetical protein FRC09_016386 [Ceratobasidium sp. 395]